MKHTHHSEPTPATELSEDELKGWFTGRLPDGLFIGSPTITSDEDEILVVGEIADVEIEKGSSEAAQATARGARIERFRDETKEQRIGVAQDAERLFGRKVSWGATCGGVTGHFTTLGVPVMTRLRISDRHVLDTLISAGVARSRSDALAWCVRLVGKHQGDWIDSLRQALEGVDAARAAGPTA